MFLFRLLPWEYGIRNLFRRPLRTSLTFAGLTTVIVLVFVVVGFIRGLERSLAVSGDPGSHTSRRSCISALGLALASANHRWGWFVALRHPRCWFGGRSRSKKARGLKREK